MTAKPETPARITRLADYTPPAYAIDTVQLRFDLDPAKTRVYSRMAVRRASGAADTAPLVLDGEDITLLSLKVDGEFVAFRQDGNTLVLDKLPAAFTLEIETLNVPQSNSQLSGLYMSGGAFFTQCEAEGFRRITYWPDRPDVMSRFHVTLRADKSKYPVLLSTAIWLRNAIWKTAATKRYGTIPSPSPATCSHWSPATWCAANKPCAQLRERRICCRSTCAPETSTKPSMRCSR
jgi:aminopeptidase N